MRSKLMTGLLLGCLGFGIAADALSQQNVNGMVTNRKSVMALQGKYMFQLVNMVQGKLPYDAAIAQRNADYLAMLSTMPWEEFQPASAGAQNTRAKDDIYKDPAKFKSYADKLQSETKALATAAHGGNQAATVAAIKSTAMACNTCHEAFSGYNGRFRFE